MTDQTPVEIWNIGLPLLLFVYIVTTALLASHVKMKRGMAELERRLEAMEEAAARVATHPSAPPAPTDRSPSA